MAPVVARGDAEPASASASAPGPDDLAWWAELAWGSAAPVAENQIPARYPTLDGPSQVTVGQPFQVSFALTTLALGTAAVTIRGAALDESGRVQLAVQEHGAASWTLDVVLLSGDFKVDPTQRRQKITLPRDGDSDWVSFDLVLPAAPPEPAAELSLLVYEGPRLLAQIGRAFVVAGHPRVAVAPLQEPPRAGVAIEARDATSPRLTLTVAPSEGAVRTAMVRAWLEVPGQPDRQWFSTAAPWPASEVSALVETTTRGLAQGRGLTLVPGAPPRTAEGQVVGMGRALWKALPDEVRVPIRALLAATGSGVVSEIEVDTTDPGFPWELIVPDDGTAPLGALARLGRWHVQSGADGVGVPPLAIVYDELRVIAPHYEGTLALPSAAAEIAALSAQPGYIRSETATVDALRSVLARPPRGVLHYAGHGVAADAAAGWPEYALLLEDAALTTTNWRGLVDWRVAEGGPLVFLNACDVGRAQQVGGLVEGWGPTLLERGAGGYVGALWPVGDAGAMRFAEAFYREVERRIASSGRAEIADILRTLRQQPEAAADPTWMAYVFYGRPEAALVRR